MGKEATMLWTKERIDREFDKRVWRQRKPNGGEAQRLCQEIYDDLTAALAAQAAARLRLEDKLDTQASIIGKQAIQSTKDTWRIAELEQENKGLYALLADRARAYSELKAQPAERSLWKPVEDGTYQDVDVDANGSELTTVTKDVHGIEWDAMIVLPDNIRLCRCVQSEDESNE